MIVQHFPKIQEQETCKQALVALLIYYTGFLVIERFGDDCAAISSANSLTHSILLTLGKMLQISGLASGLLALLDYFELTIPKLSLDL